MLNISRDAFWHTVKCRIAPAFSVTYLRGYFLILWQEMLRILFADLREEEEIERT